jgi:dTDP-4-dehydrorhamnose reductase
VKLLVTGSRGQLGRALEGSARERGWEFQGVDLPDVDVTDRASVDEAVERSHPACIINCAAFTAVDLAETRESEALAINGDAVAFLATAADRVGAKLVQVSTDYVFDGHAGRPYREEDSTAPQSAYGRTKLAGERAASQAQRALIARTAWLFGDGVNFVRSILGQIGSGVRRLKVVNDQHGSPTFAADLADAILDLAAVEAHGIVHVVNRGATTWWGLAREIVDALEAEIEVEPLATAEARRPAPRPAYSVLATDTLERLIGRRLPPWQDALRRFLAVDVARSVRGTRASD